MFMHAGLRHVGDGMLPCQERLQRFDEELGECVLWNIGLVEHWLALAYGEQNGNGFIGTERVLWLCGFTQGTRPAE